MKQTRTVSKPILIITSEHTYFFGLSCRDHRHLRLILRDETQLTTNDMLEPHFPAIPIQLSTQDTLLQPLQKLVVECRHLKINKLLPHDAEVLGRAGVEQVGEAVLDELADDVAHLLGGALYRLVVGRCRKRLLELGDRVVERDGGALALAEERVNVEAGEGLDCLLSAAPALGLGRNCVRC